jgi:hypothetical protein
MSSGSRVTIKFEDNFFDLAEMGYVQEVKLVNKVRIDFKINEEGRKYVAKTTDSKFATIRESITKDKSPTKSDLIYELEIIDAGNFPFVGAARRTQRDDRSYSACALA